MGYESYVAATTAFAADEGRKQLEEKAEKKKSKMLQGLTGEKDKPMAENEEERKKRVNRASLARGSGFEAPRVGRASLLGA